MTGEVWGGPWDGVSVSADWDWSARLVRGGHYVWAHYCQLWVWEPR
jgi:hypothetical protein